MGHGSENILLLLYFYLHVYIHYFFIVKLRSRSRYQVRSRSGPRSGTKGPRTKGQRPGPGLTINLVCHPPPLTTQQTFLGEIMSPNQYCMTSNYVPLILAFKMTFRMTFRMTKYRAQEKDFDIWSSDTWFDICKKTWF